MTSAQRTLTIVTLIDDTNPVVSEKYERESQKIQY